jgi:hypothetical protein
MNIIFLDIDGVLTSPRTGYFNFDIYAVNFLRWICQNSDTKIVITSTWRKNHNKEFFEKIFSKVLHDDWQTPIINKLSKTRGDEIQKWLDNHKEIKDYIILDDDNDMLKSQKDHLISTDPENGLNFDNMGTICFKLEIDKVLNECEKLYQCEEMFASYNLSKYLNESK